MPSRPQASRIEHIDFGGGLGINYHGETPPAADALWQLLLAKLDARGYGQRKLVIEPGRSLIGNAGICLTETVFRKPGEQKNFLIVDAAMNDLPRPAMYEAYHAIVPVHAPREAESQHLGRGRPGVRERRLAGPRPRTRGADRRSAGSLLSRRLLHEHGQHLQQLGAAPPSCWSMAIRRDWCARANRSRISCDWNRCKPGLAGHPAMTATARKRSPCRGTSLLI